MENARLKASLEQALTRIGELEARLGTTSKNSGKPPSSDGLAKPARSRCAPSPVVARAALKGSRG